MSRQAFSYCLSSSKRSGFIINQVPLFGPIIGEVFVEEEEIGNEEAGARNDEVHEEPKGPTMVILEEPAHETQQETVQQIEEPVFEPANEPVIEPLIEQTSEQMTIEETDNVFEEILREEAQRSTKQISKEISQEEEQEPQEQTTLAPGSIISLRKRSRSDDDSESEDEEAHSLRAKKSCSDREA